MEGEASRGRGRGRGMVPGSNEERGDLRRPLATPQELSVGGMQQPQQQNPMMSNNAYNDTIANAQMKQFYDNHVQQMHQQPIRQGQQPQQQQAQGPTQQHDPRLQAQITLASQQSPQIHMLPLQLQQQQQQHQQHQQLQLQQVQLALQAQQQQQQQQNQQILQLGLQPNSRNVTYLPAQKQQEYEDLNRRKAELEMIMQQKNQLQQQQQQQQAQHLQQLLMRTQNQQQNQEIEQKLAQLQLGQNSSNALYLQQTQQQQQQQQQQQHLQQQIHQQYLLKQHQQAQQTQMTQLLVQRQYAHQQQQEQPAIAMSAASDHGKSILSAEAAEFVPRFGGSGGSQRPNQSPSPAVANHHMSPPGMNIPHSTGPPEHQSLIPIQPEYSTHPVVMQVDTAVVQLSGNPSKYEAISRQLTSVLSWNVKEENLMREVVTVIFEQGVGEANFRFTGGKLCEHLVKNVAQQYNGPSFKSILLQRCQEEFEYRHEYLAVLYYDRLIGYSFFLAEILTRLLMPSGQPITKLREALCEMLTILLDVSISASLKCVAQVLKMSGRFLEMGGSREFEVVMVKLRDIAMTPLPPNTKTLLMSVVEFRAANWGCNDSAESEEGGGEGSAGEGENGSKDASATAANKPAVNGEDQKLPVLGTIFYGPGGQIHHIEEDCPEDCPSDSDDASAKLAAAPQVCELEGEEGAAFDQFLQSMN